MKIRFAPFPFALSLLSAFSVQLSTFGQGTAFTYQGRLNEITGPANGIYDFTFQIFDLATGGSQGGTVTTNGASLTDGLFTVTLDFGVSPFTAGVPRWLEITVRTNGASSFGTLTPRQALTATPYAITAGNLTGTLPATGLSGTYSGALTFSNTANIFSGNGGGLSSVNAATLGGFSPTNFWRTTGNSSAGTNWYIGTADYQPLELRVNGGRGLRIQPTLNSAPNFIAGSADNAIQSGATGGSIGGGRLNTIADGSNNTIAAGEQNSIRTNSSFSTISGGRLNVIADGSNNTIAAGEFNQIQSGSDFSFIGGGRSNRVTGSYAVVPGGAQVVAAGDYSFAAGRRANALHSGSFVWADSANTDFVSSANNQFLIRASGGVGIGKTNPATELDVNGTITATAFAGSFAASQLTGTIAPAQLAKPPQSGSLSSTSIPNDFGVATFSVAFSPAFSSAPQVTLSLETDSDFLAEQTSLFVKSKSATGFTGRQLRRQPGITADVTGGLGRGTSLAVVNGNPAITYGNGPLRFVRANDPDGTGWNLPRVLDSGSAAYYTSLAVVDGNPAVSYYDSIAEALKFARAIDADGMSWQSPMTLDGAPHAAAGFFTSLAVVNGNPAISYQGTGANLLFIRAASTSGGTWKTPVSVDNVGNVGKYTSLAVVKSFPAISYYDSGNGDLKYVRALDANGDTWDTPVIVASSGDVGQYTSLAVVNSAPAISYYDVSSGVLMYVRATDNAGFSWGTPVPVDTNGNVGQYTSLSVINGRPAISYWDSTQSSLKYARAIDGNGAVWGSPVSMDVGTVGGHTSLSIVNGQPAISYYDSANSRLKFIRQDPTPYFINWIALEP